ncbi:MAG: hypothetical protein ACFFDW_15770 [Candidatus Thorarchaeota archaeon]
MHENEGIPLGENFVDLLTRLDKISLEKRAEISEQYNCNQEFAGLIYLLNTDLNIKPEFILHDLNQELLRLEANNNQIPEVETYIHNFTIQEGKWIAYLRGAFPKVLLEEAKKIQAEFSKLSKSKGTDMLTLATQLMMNRQYIAAKVIIPIIEKWKEEHEDSNDFDIGLLILAGLKNSIDNDKIIQEMEQAKKQLVDQIKILGDILSNAEHSNWIIRSTIEAEILYEDLCHELKEQTYKGISDIILWIATKHIERDLGDFTAQEDIAKMITRFQLESSLGLATASPIATLEYDLLSLNFKDEFAKSKLSEEMIIKTWKEARLGGKPLDIGREILTLLIDYCNVSPEFLSKIPAHFDFIVENYQYDQMRLSRALERMKIKGRQLTNEEMKEAVILDYLILFTNNYIAGKMTANVKDIELPEIKEHLDLLSEEKEFVDMVDASVKRGIRTKDKAKAIEILTAQVSSMYPRCLSYVRDEVSVGECIIYGVFNSHGIDITRAEARELIQKHFRRMMVSAGTTTKKRIDSAVQMAIRIEIEEKIINREMR